MSTRCCAALIYCTWVLMLLAQDNAIDAESVLKNFTKRVGDYVELHNRVKGEVHGLKPTSSAEAIEKYEHRFAARLREERSGAARGSIFSPDIAVEFRRLISATMRGPDGSAIRIALQRAAPVHLALRVNHAYPSGAPLQSTPPSLLLNLPHLPPEVDYRVVGSDLILRDVDANLIVDVLPNAIS